MTLEDVKKMDAPVITAAVAGHVLGCDPHYIRLEARLHPEKLGFPVIVIGKRVRIPRAAFVRYLEGDFMERRE